MQDLVVIGRVSALGVRHRELALVARVAAARARRDGALLPRPCIACGAGVVDAHHCDYRHPLLVLWLCRSCHATAHRWIRLAEAYAEVDNEEAWPELAAANRDLNTAATRAYQRAAKESGKSRAGMAGAMEISIYSLERYMIKGWSLPGVKRLAAATGQNVVRMLGRESTP